MDKEWIKDILPLGYDYKLIKWEIASTTSDTNDLKFDFEFRVNVDNEESVFKLINDFNVSSGCTYNVKTGRQDRRQSGEMYKFKLGIIHILRYGFWVFF